MLFDYETIARYKSKNEDIIQKYENKSNCVKDNVHKSGIYLLFIYILFLIFI